MIYLMGIWISYFLKIIQIDRICRGKYSTNIEIKKQRILPFHTKLEIALATKWNKKHQSTIQHLQGWEAGYMY